MFSQQFNGGEAIGSFQHRETFLAKHCGDRNPQGFLVFHHQDRSARRPPGFHGTHLWVLMLLGRLSGARQHDAKCRALANPTS
jgi:hypothetical protein